MASGSPHVATSSDVARRAGVSRATVSHILNHQSGRFSPETIERVHRAAAELGYVPSAAGRALAKGRSDVVVIVLPNTTYFNLQEFLDPLCDELAAQGLSAVVRFARPDPLPLRRLVEALRPAGIIDLGGLSRQEVAELRERDCPVVPAFDSDGTIRPHAAVGRLQVEHLAARGYGVIGYALLSDEREDPYGQGRFEGAVEACRDLGLPEPILLRVRLELDPAVEALRAGLERARASAPGARVGIGCYNDEVAMAVLAAARELHLGVPERLGVIGMDASQIGRLLSPRLTTIRSRTEDTALLARTLIAARFGSDPRRPSDVEAVVDDRFYELLPGGTT